MKCLRIYATADGGSHFGEVDLRFCVAQSSCLPISRNPANLLKGPALLVGCVA
jgi:hypothetical protein